jgi:Protein kinase domain
MFCSECGGELSPKNKFCPACGSRVSDGSAVASDSAEGETLAPPAPRRTPTPSPSSRAGKPPSSGAPRLSSSDPIGGGRFTPGMIVADRYRIVALAGRGGMGEVYRADDLKLSQTVAIKFLPDKLTTDPSALERFHSEVRIARQVSHPNVCRVFDIGETEGVTFLTMEYVDGEDMASLIRRIGRLSPDKATEIARQICAGLAAAHERGVIHRDLKPANVMLDGLGKARITDFGLASIAASLQGAEVHAGTPAYMAPEQLTGKEVTFKSDLYALGLVLYELLTGKRAFDARTLPELIRLREQGDLSRPSTLVKDLDPLLERVILRCLEKDPAQRPSSALQIAAALPGGDPLAAALAAGETPSPEMVAASGQSEGLRPVPALACLLGVAAALALMLFVVASRTKMVAMLPFGDTPDALAVRAREVIRSLGYTGTPGDAAFGFTLNSDYFHFIETKLQSSTRWNVLRQPEPPPITFWYRQSPRPLASFAPQDNLIWGRVTSGEPPQDVSGMKLISLSADGRLLHFEAVPPQVDESAADARAPDWNPLFAAAGLDPARFKQVPPKWFPLAWGDSRSAWEGTWPGRPDIPLRIEAASYRGQPIYFQMISPWTRPQRMEASIRIQNRIGQIFGLTLLGILIGGAVWIARRNIRLGRGDYQGASRLAVFILAVGVVNWALLAHHASSFLEVVFLILSISVGLFFASFTWLLYVALEPYVRRHWPDTIVSWTRMLQGKFRDPVVGRDVLLGALFGVSSSLLEHQQYLVEKFFGRVPGRPVNFALYSLEGVRGSLATLFSQANSALTGALVIFFLFFILKLLFRRNWLAAVAMALLYCIPSLGAPNPLIDAIFTAPFILAYLFLLQRFGLVCLAALVFTDQIVNTMPIVMPLNAWYAEGGIIAIAAILAIAVYGFQMARAGKPLFSESLLDS